MALSDVTKQLLCGIAIAGGAVAAGAVGVNVATGVIELATNGGNLLLAVQKEQEDRCRALLEHVAKAVEDSYAKAHAQGRALSAQDDVEAAFAQLDETLAHIKPSTRDIVEAGFNAEALYTKMKARLPDNSVFCTSDAAGEILRKIVTGTYTLVRSDEVFIAAFTTLGFERVIGDLRTIDAKLDNLLDAMERMKVELMLQAKRHHEEQMAAQAAETGIPRENLRPLFEAAEQAVPEADFENAIRNAVAALQARAVDPVALLNDPDEIVNAIRIARQKLAQADTEGAIEHLRQARAERAEIRQEWARSEARLANEQAEIHRLAFQMEEAIAAFEEAAKLEPDDPWPWFHIGDIRMHRGNLATAKADYSRGKSVAEDTGNDRDVMVARNRLGDVAVAQGELGAARSAYEAGLALAEDLAKRDPDNAEWQRDLSVSHNKLGDVAVAQGDLGAARSAFEAGLAIREDLAKRDPDNAEWRRDLSVSHNKLGDVAVAQGELGAARSAYEAGLAIAEDLAGRDPDNAGWQRDLSVSHNKLGDVAVAQGDLGAARLAFEADLAIAEDLAKRDPGNTGWQRDLSVSHNKLGDVAVARGELGAARSAYEAGLTIREALAKRDPDNAGWQRDLSLSHERLGDVAVAQGELGTARSAYQAGLAIREDLAKRDPDNAGWRRDLSVSHNKLGDVAVAQGELGAARSAYEAGIAIAEDLAGRDPDNAGWQRDLSVSHNKLGDVAVAQGELGAARSAYEAGLAIREDLARRDPDNAGWQRDLITGNLRLAQAGDQAAARYAKALRIARDLESDGRLAPRDAWMIADLEKRLADAEGRAG